MDEQAAAPTTPHGSVPADAAPRRLAAVLAALVAVALATGAAGPGDPVGGRGLDPSPAARTAEAPAATVRVAAANISSRLAEGAFVSDLARTYASQADLVALSEVGYRSIEQLQRSGYRVWRGERAVGQARSTAVAWHGARWSLVEAGRKRLVRRGPQRWDARRSATWATLRGTGARSGVGQVSLVSVHHMVNPARYGPRKPRRQWLYARGVRRIAALVVELSSRGPVVVAGDFNSPWWADDPWGPRRLLGPTAMPQPYAMEDSMSVLGRTPTHDAGGVVDYVFSQPSQATPTAQQTVPLNSDHRLLTVDLRLR